MPGGSAAVLRVRGPVAVAVLARRQLGADGLCPGVALGAADNVHDLGRVVVGVVVELDLLAAGGEDMAPLFLLLVLGSIVLGVIIASVARKKLDHGFHRFMVSFGRVIFRVCLFSIIGLLIGAAFGYAIDMGT